MQDSLATLIKITGACEIQIERARHAIRALSSNAPEKAFDLIDKNYSGLVTVSEIYNFLRSHDVDAKDKEIRMIVTYHDFSKRGGLTQEDFLGAITPRQENLAVRKVEDKELGQALVRFFVRELELLRKTESLRHELSDSEVWTTFDSFRCIDIKGKGSFTHIDLDAFLQKNGVVLSNHDIAAAFGRLDKTNKKKVTYEDFLRNLLHDECAAEKLKQLAAMQAAQAHSHSQKKSKSPSKYERTNSPSFSTGKEYITSKYYPHTHSSRESSPNRHSQHSHHHGSRHTSPQHSHLHTESPLRSNYIYPPTYHRHGSLSPRNSPSVTTHSTYIPTYKPSSVSLNHSHFTPHSNPDTYVPPLTGHTPYKHNSFTSKLPTYLDDYNTTK